MSRSFSEPLQGQEPQAGISRRQFLARSVLLGLGGVSAGCRHLSGGGVAEPIIDVHQHLGYSGRPDEVLLAHQRAMGVSRTILLPAGRAANCPATHRGRSNGLQAGCYGNQACWRFVKANHGSYRFGANEVPGLPETMAEIEKYLRLGAIIIAEQKFGVDCDAPAMERIYEMAAGHGAPVLMHWQHGMYNYGFERFDTMLEKHPRTVFIGHAQTWWANIDRKNADQTVMYPRGRVTPGGLTDRYLSDYPNIYGDLSAGSGLNALTRDEDFTREFLKRHQDKLLFGSDCNDWVGAGPGCQGAQTIAAVRRLSPGKEVERKLLYGNAKRLLRI